MSHFLISSFNYFTLSFKIRVNRITNRGNSGFEER
jgi:hypothetical protein